MTEEYFEPPDELRFTLWSLEELLGKEFPAAGWLIERLVPIPGLTFIAGKAGKGKSLITLALAKAVSNGMEFLEHFQTKESGVLIIDEENQPSEIQKRLRLFQVCEGSPVFVMSMQGFQITNSQHIAAVLALAKENGCGVIIIDSLVRTHTLDENQAKEMRQVRKALSPLFSDGLAVIIIHHQGKLGADQKEAGMRGSSELDAMAESVLMVSKKERILTITQSKSRQDEAVPTFEVELTGDGKEQLNLVYKGLDSTNKLTAAKNAVLEILGTGEQLNQKEICSLATEQYDLPTNKVRTALENLVQSKDIVRNKGTRGELLYSIWSKEEV